MKPPKPVPNEPAARPPFGGVMLAEGFGTFLLVFFGCGSVHTAVLLGAQSGLWQVAIVWGLAVMLAIFAVGAISGAHINPAITIALATWGQHPWQRVVPYITAQFLGAFAAAAVLYTLFSGFLVAKEREKEVVRGEPGSIVTAMCYGEYFPNPGSIAAMAGPYDAKAHAELRTRFSAGAAWFAEFLGTLVLTCMVFAVTDRRNSARPSANLCAGLYWSHDFRLDFRSGPINSRLFQSGPRLWTTTVCLLRRLGNGRHSWHRRSKLVDRLYPRSDSGALAGGGLYHYVLHGSLSTSGHRV